MRGWQLCGISVHFVLMCVVWLVFGLIMYCSFGGVVMGLLLFVVVTLVWLVAVSYCFVMRWFVGCCGWLVGWFMLVVVMVVIMVRGGVSLSFWLGAFSVVFVVIFVCVCWWLFAVCLVVGLF